MTSYRTPGALDFAACYERRVEADFDGVRVRLLSLADLLANKRASGRPRDLADAQKREKVEKPRPGTKKSGRRKK